MGAPGLDETSDSDLVAASLGEPRQFSGVVERHFAEIFGYLARRVGRQIAEDLAADTFAAAFSGRSGYDVELSEVRPWLYGIATNLVRHHWRAEVRRLRATSRTQPTIVADDEASRVLDRVVASAQVVEIAQGLAALDSAQRDALILVAVVNLSYEEAAAALEIPIGTLRSRIFRGRAALRAQLSHVPLFQDQQPCRTEEQHHGG